MLDNICTVGNVDPRDGEGYGTVIVTVHGMCVYLLLSVSYHCETPNAICTGIHFVKCSPNYSVTTLMNYH